MGGPAGDRAPEVRLPPEPVHDRRRPAHAPFLALVLIASLAVGDEFRFGTIRTSLLAASNRRRFLVARLVSLFALTVGLFVALARCSGRSWRSGPARLVGAELGRDAPRSIDPVARCAWLAAQILTTMVVIVLATALTVLLRSGALPLLLIILRRPDRAVRRRASRSSPRTSSCQACRRRS